MILVDTSVWIGHLRAHDSELARLIDDDAVYTHPFVIGEIALGRLPQREVVLDALNDLPQVVVATADEVFRNIEHHALFGRGIGYVDVCLLAAASLTANTWLWTLDNRLEAAAADFGLAASPPFSKSKQG